MNMKQDNITNDTPHQDTTMMRAALAEQYGPPEVLVFRTIEKPTLQDDEMLVKVHATSMNVVDTSSRSGGLIPRLFGGLRKPKQALSGSDIAGTVVQVGKSITKFKIGDRVFGGARSGTYAEFAKCSEQGVTHMPPGMSYDQGGGIFIAALSAIQFLRDQGNIKDGMDILIYGAAGGIGTFAMQYARTFNVTITAVCSERNHALVKQLGADFVIDYNHQDFTTLDQKYDLIFDTVGKLSLRKWKRALKEEGVFVNSGNPSMNFLHLLLIIFGNRFRKRKMKFAITQSSVSDLDLVARLMEEGKMETIIDKTYSFDQLVEATRYYEAGHSAGKVIVKFNEN